MNTNDLIEVVYQTILGRRPSVGDVEAWSGLAPNTDGLVGLLNAAGSSEELQAVWWRSPLFSRVITDAVMTDKSPAIDQVFFMHIPKTAGLALDLAVIPALPKFRSLAMMAVDNAVAMPAELISRIWFVSGHLGRLAGGLLEPSARTILMLRNPVDRAHSHYLHAVRSDGWPAHHVVRNMSFDEYLDDPRFTPYWSNFQARYLTRSFDFTPYLQESVARARVGELLPGVRLGPIAPIQAIFDLEPVEFSDVQVGLARTVISDADAVLTTELLDRSIHKLGALFGGAQITPRRTNESPESTTGQISDWARRRIVDANQLDIELWERATVLSGG